MELAGKVAVVTGGAMGIGLAVARALSDAGARVVIADRDSEAGKQAAADVGGLFLRADVSEDDELRRMIATAERFGGGLDVLVNNAGGVDDPLFPEAPVDHWERVLEVNLRAVMVVTQLAIEAMRKRVGTSQGSLSVPPNASSYSWGNLPVPPDPLHRSASRTGGFTAPLHRSASRTGGFTAGAIVNVASVAGLGAGPHDAPEYAAAKAGVVRFTAALRSLAAEGIRVNAICPDYVDTPAVQRSLAQMSDDERKAVPRLVAAGTIASDILGLLGDDSVAGRVLVRFAEAEPYLLPEGIPH
jgi:NAD(P)-dependent dehydrogenase (short-subunit alcohol dehydrogenase family)